MRVDSSIIRVATIAELEKYGARALTKMRLLAPIAGGSPIGATATLVASAARTATGNSGAINPGVDYQLRGVVMYVNVSAVSGTSPTLVLAVQGQDSVSSTFGTVHSGVLPNITATGLYVVELSTAVTQQVASYPAALNAELPIPFQIAWTIGGTTPSFTFSISGQYLT